MLKIPESMYGKGPKNNPAPEKDWRNSGSHAYGDADLRMLNPEKELYPSVVITYSAKKGK